MWPNPEETADLVTFTGKILNEKLHFLCDVRAFIDEKEYIKIFSLYPLNASVALI